jgi:hypothetical protein
MKLLNVCIVITCAAVIGAILVTLLGGKGGTCLFVQIATAWTIYWMVRK